MNNQTNHRREFAPLNWKIYALIFITTAAILGWTIAGVITLVVAGWPAFKAGLSHHDN